MGRAECLRCGPVRGVDMSGLISIAGGWVPQGEWMEGGRTTGGGGGFWCESGIGLSPAPWCLLPLPGKRSALFSGEETAGASPSGILPVGLPLEF